MANKIQIRRGLKAILPTLSVGEPGLCTDTEEVYIGNGAKNIQLTTYNDLDIRNNTNNVKFIAHRGVSGIAPENTLPAYELAGKLGFYGGECDTSPTSDGVWILMHDDTVDRTTTGTGVTTSLTSTYVSSLTVDGGINSIRYPNLKVPTLEDFLLCCKKYNIVPVIEIKGNTTQANYKTFVNLLIKHNFIDKCIVISFSYEALQSVRFLNKRIVIQYIADITAENIQMVKALGNSGIDTNYPKVTKALVDLAHNNGVHVNVWTIDDYQSIKDMVNFGVDMITTNIIKGVL